MIQNQGNWTQLIEFDNFSLDLVLFLDELDFFTGRLKAMSEMNIQMNMIHKDANSSETRVIDAFKMPIKACEDYLELFRPWLLKRISDGESHVVAWNHPNQIMSIFETPIDKSTKRRVEWKILPAVVAWALSIPELSKDLAYYSIYQVAVFYWYWRDWGIESHRIACRGIALPWQH